MRQTCLYIVENQGSTAFKRFLFGDLKIHLDQAKSLDARIPARTMCLERNKNNLVISEMPF